LSKGSGADTSSHTDGEISMAARKDVIFLLDTERLKFYTHFWA